MKTLWLVIFQMSVFAVSAQLAPEWFVYPGTPVAFRFDDVFFVNDTTGWAVDGSGDAYKTTDAGVNWELQMAIGNYFRSVEFFDSETGFIGSLYGRMFKTINGGTTWDEITATMPHSFSGICGMSVADDSTIYACGVWSGPAYIFKSTDRGETWTYIDMSSFAFSLVDIKFTDALHGFVTGQNIDLDSGGIILYTADGGLNWEEKISTGHPNDYVWKVQLLDDTLAFGAIANEAMGYKTRFLKSEDAGMHWEVKTVSEDYYYVEMCGFINADTGWTGSYQQFETFDGGDTWHEHTFGNNLNRFFRINDNLAFASGTQIYVYSDTNYVEIPDDSTTTITPAITFPHTIISVVPNPTAGKISVNYSIGNYTTIDLSLYDSGGHALHQFYHGPVQPGTYVLHWDSHLPPGNYMITMHSNEGLIGKQLIIVE